MAEPSLEFKYEGGPLYTPPAEEEISIGELMDSSDEIIEGLSGTKTEGDKIVDNSLALTASLVGDSLLRPSLNSGINKLPLSGISGFLKGQQGNLLRIIPQASRFIANAIPGVGTYLMAQQAAPYVREQSRSQVDSIMDTGALEGSDPSYFDDEKLRQMSLEGDPQADQILQDRSRIDGKVRQFDTDPDIYDEIENSMQNSADSMETVTIQRKTTDNPYPDNPLIAPEFSTDEEFNKYDLDGSGMLSRDEIINYRSTVNRHEVNLDDY